MNVELRTLEARDLDVVEAIERESYPTPWSRSMFDAELRKPSSLALGAFTEEEELVGYAFVSRYVDAWHVMNVAVADAYRRRGVASTLLATTPHPPFVDNQWFGLAVLLSVILLPLCVGAAGYLVPAEGERPGGVIVLREV